MDKRDLTVAILAGGLGTRLRGAVPDLPKVIAPVAGRPFVTHLLDQLAAADLREVVLLTGFRGEQVREELCDRYGPLRLTYAHESSPLGTGGALRSALPLLPGRTLLVLNGDSYFDLDLAALRRFHASRGGVASLALAHVPDVSRFGRVVLGTNDQVIEFAEKAAGDGPGRINAGVYLLERSLAEAIPQGRAVSLEREVLPDWVARGKVFGQGGEGRFLDIGTPESYAEAADFFLTPDSGTCAYAR